MTVQLPPEIFLRVKLLCKRPSIILSLINNERLTIAELYYCCGQLPWMLLYGGVPITTIDKLFVEGYQTKKDRNLYEHIYLLGKTNVVRNLLKYQVDTNFVSKYFHKCIEDNLIANPYEFIEEISTDTLYEFGNDYNIEVIEIIINMNLISLWNIMEIFSCNLNAIKYIVEKRIKPLNHIDIDEFIPSNIIDYILNNREHFSKYCIFECLMRKGQYEEAEHLYSTIDRKLLGTLYIESRTYNEYMYVCSRFNQFEIRIVNDILNKLALESPEDFVKNFSEYLTHYDASNINIDKLLSHLNTCNTNTICLIFQRIRQPILWSSLVEHGANYVKIYTDYIKSSGKSCHTGDFILKCFELLEENNTVLTYLGDIDIDITSCSLWDKLLSLKRLDIIEWLYSHDQNLTLYISPHDSDTLLWVIKNLNYRWNNIRINYQSIEELIKT